MRNIPSCLTKNLFVKRLIVNFEWTWHWFIKKLQNLAIYGVSMSLFQIRSMFSFGSATYWSYVSNYLQLRLINIPDLRNFLPSVCKAFFSNFSGSAIYLSEKYSTLRRSQFELVLVFLNNLQYSWSLAVTGKKANTTLWKLLYINLKILMIEPTVTFIENFGHVT